MKKTHLPMAFLILFGAIWAAGCMGPATGMKQPKPPFGSKSDIEFSQMLWNVLVSEKLTGPGMIRSLPYEGIEPHGVILEQLSTVIRVNDTTGVVYVKHNYLGEDITRSKVVNTPGPYLKAITVMFKREAGYDPDNQDWFWVKYRPDGSLHATPRGVPLAGRVAKGMDQGCIACHADADGGDYLFNNTAVQLD